MQQTRTVYNLQRPTGQICSAHQKTKMAATSFYLGAMEGGVKRPMWVWSGSCPTNGCTLKRQKKNIDPQQQQQCGAPLDLGRVEGKILKR